MAKFTIGDRIKRTGPHLANRGQSYKDNECRVGWVGVITSVHADGEVSVRWDKTGGSSRIVASSLALEDDLSDEEVAALFGITPPKPCKKCGCPTSGKH